MTLDVALDQPATGVGAMLLPAVEVVRLREDAALGTAADGVPVLRQGRFQLRLARLTTGQLDMVSALSAGWNSEYELAQMVSQADGESRVLAGQLLLRRLDLHSWLSRRLQTPARPLLQVTPRRLGAGTHLPGRLDHRPDAETTYTVSRFASMTATGAALQATAPGAATAVAVLDPAVCAVLARAAGDGIRIIELARALQVDRPTASRVLDELVAAGVLIAMTGRDAEDEVPKAFWNTAELALHELSRPGRSSSPIGGTFRFDGALPPAPLRRNFPGARVVDLPAPNPDIGEDVPLGEILRRRRSVRAHHPDRPIRLGELAEFLHRVQRLTPIGTGHGQELGARPYPSGGAVCELEIYPVVLCCEGLEPGVYHYESIDHQLEQLCGPGPSVDRMLGYAAAAAVTGPPQVLLVITARIDRLLWKYEGIGYAMALKNCGVLTELMYLVATALGLAPCALGAGDAAAFAEATSLDPLLEPSIGEFLLGIPSPRETDEHTDERQTAS